MPAYGRPINRSRNKKRIPFAESPYQTQKTKPFYIPQPQRQKHQQRSLKDKYMPLKFYL
ncbi:hypothetical protein E1A91_A02G113100v1 [Gossypium mustelinum]|uniref:Uncharacterized protein n=3 Tax=Gossypium TaxID=3633 RepID=A0A5J5WNL7_GOSBA|nr:hypothetical protein ES319_A02G109100v1 [Gossypium barbadense]TYJ46322.1 hypothetical protein E1A91_A02G113100v1 [Gossypium mustelinum]